jgi:hypothetical protein
MLEQLVRHIILDCIKASMLVEAAVFSNKRNGVTEKMGSVLVTLGEDQNQFHILVSLC